MATISFNYALEILKIILIFSTLCLGHNNSSKLEQMPVLYNFDNYKDCMKQNILEQTYPAKYCLVLVEIQPEEGSQLWRQISLVNSNKYNYRHDRIFRGVCTERCKEFSKNLQNNVNYDNVLLTSEETEMFKQFYNTSLDRTMRHEYHNEIYECINQEYMKDYNLSTRIFINFCVDPKQSKEKDIYFYLTLLLIAIIIILNILSSLYDANLKSKQFKPNDKYYEVQNKQKFKRYLTAFSIYRNYKRLVRPNKSDIGIDLTFLDGFRAILCLLIVFEHSLLIQVGYIENPSFLENSIKLLISKMLFHAFVWLELFFVLSGLLLFVKFDKTQYVTPQSSFIDCLHVFVRLLISRYLRYLPSLLFVIIFDANITYYNNNGGFARTVTDSSCLSCRNNWWQNLLMINNYYMKSSCLMHTWYIAADFQLYGLFLLLLIIMAKYPKKRVIILTAVAFLAAAINFGVNYILKLDSAFTLKPETLRYFYIQNIETGKHMYFSSYTNINSFLVGIVCGFIYMKFLRNSPVNKIKLDKLLKYSPYIGWPCIVGILYLGATILMHTETTIWTSAYGLLHRHMGITIVAIIVILRGMSNGGGFLKLPLFRLLSRISFQVYLWQIIVLTNMLVTANEPIYINVFIILIFGIVLYVSTIVVALVVALMVEYPAAEIIAIIDIEKNIKPIKTS